MSHIDPPRPSSWLLRPHPWLAINFAVYVAASIVFVSLHGIPTPYAAVVHAAPLVAATLGAIVLHHLARTGTHADPHWPNTPSRTRSVWLMWPLASVIAFLPSLLLASAWTGAAAVFTPTAMMWSAAFCCAAAAATGRLGTEPRCAKCDYPAPSNFGSDAVCSECAAPLVKKGAVVLGKDQSSTRLKITATILFYAGTGAFLALSATRGTITNRLFAALPTTTLIRVALEDPFSEAPWSALSTRTLTPDQKEHLLERMTEIDMLGRAGNRFLTAISANPSVESQRFRELLIRYAQRSERDQRFQFDLYLAADNAAIPPGLVPDNLRDEWCRSAFDFQHSQTRAPENSNSIRITVRGYGQYGRGNPSFQAFAAIESLTLDGQPVPLPIPKPVKFHRMTSDGIVFDPFDLPDHATTGPVRPAELIVTVRVVRTNQITRRNAPGNDQSAADTSTPLHLFTPEGKPIAPAWALWTNTIEVKGPVTLGGWTRPPRKSLP